MEENLVSCLDAEEIEEQARERLQAVLINRPRIPPVPLAVLTTIELGQTSQMLGLARYVADDGLIGSYDVFSVLTSPSQSVSTT